MLRDFVFLRRKVFDEYTQFAVPLVVGFVFPEFDTTTVIRKADNPANFLESTKADSAECISHVVSAGGCEKQQVSEAKGF
eukprot:scaffold1717_cov169-Amphora_coffeaeformis.AAC.16